jgi:hypothetical protein
MEKRLDHLRRDGYDLNTADALAASSELVREINTLPPESPSAPRPQ